MKDCSILYRNPGGSSGQPLEPETDDDETGSDGNDPE